MSAVCTQLLRSVRPPLCREAELEEAASSGGRLWVAEGELRRLQRARLSLHRVARLCGQHFGLALLLSVLKSLVRMVLMTYFLVLLLRWYKFVQKESLVVVYVTCVELVFAAGSLLAMCWVCSSASARAATAGRLMDLILAIRPRSSAPGVLQLSVEKLAFSAAGFFDIDLHLFAAVIGTVVTYIVILAQFFV
ncbi:gustatory receptor 23a-like [Schistocerca nitens]|uniref:gustatory receptor 23a-like n=1 Tax=Schistocerca nitens TaxID=7011 RepID=UPI002118BF75|nr:gustatory receptor 23a-like [Schistocerca nitens]